jgi:phosphoglycolate phosphatase-like HAD superfamily hydrolase
MNETLDSATRLAVVPRAWLFDLDGTLISSVERFHAAYCSALESRGRSSVDEPTFVERYRSGELVSSLGLHADDADGFWRELMEVFLARSDLGSLLPGAPEALSDLAARGSKVALVTGRASSEDALRTELRDHGLDSFFESVTSLGELSQMRLSPTGAITKTALFSRACAELEVEPADAGLVTDWPVEVVEGLEFGFAICVGVLTGRYEREDFAADPRIRTVTDLTEFPDLLDELAGVPTGTGAR